MTVIKIAIRLLQKYLLWYIYKVIKLAIKKKYQKI